MLVQKSVVIGMNAVKYLKDKGGVHKVADMNTAIGGTQYFNEQVMRKLRIAGLVTSVRGPGGGYTLDKHKLVTVYDINKALGYEHSRPPKSSIEQVLQASIKELLSTIVL